MTVQTLNSNPESQPDGRRIARNTLMLYLRQFVVMGVSLFTVRLLLDYLGVRDYGVYTVIAGVVVLVTFLSTAMTQATQRYLAFYIGRGDTDGLRRMFAMSINVHLLICAVLLLLAETAGLWFVFAKLQFPDTVDSTTVMWVYQMAVVAFIIKVMHVPYRSAIISYEKMDFFAYLGLAEAFLKLGSVFILLAFAPSARLVVYSVALVGVAGGVWACYILYCHFRCPHCRYLTFWHRGLFKDLMGFTSWNLLTSICNVSAQQGINIIFNMFRGVIVNAAMGVTNQVVGAAILFLNNFQMAFNPQIIKLYAAGAREEFFNLVFRASRVSFTLMFIVGLPVIICCGPILHIWLVDVPPYTEQFIQLMMVFAFIDALTGSLWTAAQATGRIRAFMICNSALLFANIPTAWGLMAGDCSPVWVFVGRITFNVGVLVADLIVLRRACQLPVGSYLRKVVLPAVIVMLVIPPLPIMVDLTTTGTWGWISAGLLAFALALGACLMIMLSKNERAGIRRAVLAKLWRH